jgi:DNA-binding NtrC family response regulator
MDRAGSGLLTLRRDAVGERLLVCLPKQTILVVDDDQQILGLIVALLEYDGEVRVLSANDPIDAIRIATRGEAIDLLLSDVDMPEMSGTALAEVLTVERPDLRVILMSGAQRPEPPTYEYDFLPKPFTPARLLDAVAQSLRTPLAGGRILIAALKEMSRTAETEHLKWKQ